MSNKQVIFEATIGLASDQVLATPDVDAAYVQYRTAYGRVSARLHEAGQPRNLALDLEETVNAYASELVRAAFLAGLAFDGRALLLEAAAG